MVLEQADNQLLMCTIDGRTRSWLMVSTAQVPGGSQLYFGSAVVLLAKSVQPSSGRSEIGLVFKALLSFHKRYSRSLLSAAARRLS